jgi:hypothetical protein
MSTSQTTVGNLAVELGLSDEQFRQSLAYAQVQAERAAAQMQARVNQVANSVAQPAAAGGGLASRAQGLLNISRAIDDVQYGFRGVVNNIEGIVMGLGYGAGVAGAATIAGVALNMIIPKIQAIVAASDPMKDLSENLKAIQGSGVGNTFWGIADSARATDAAFKAALTTLKDMRVQSEKVNFFVGGPGMAAPGSMQNSGQTQGEIFAQQMRVNELGRAAARGAFDAARGQEAFTAGALAGNVETQNQQDIRKLNQDVFRRAVEKFGGGQQLFDALQTKAPGNANLFGEFQRGDSKAAQEAVFRLRLEAEQAAAVAKSYEETTGHAKELARIEEERSRTAKQTAEFIQDETRWFERAARADEKRSLDAAGRSFDQQMQDFESANKEQASLIRRRDSLMNSMRRSEIIGAADVFGRNLNAGMKSEELKQLEEINKGIQDLKPITGLG